MKTSSSGADRDDAANNRDGAAHDRDQAADGRDEHSVQQEERSHLRNQALLDHLQIQQQEAASLLLARGHQRSEHLSAAWEQAGVDVEAAASAAQITRTQMVETLREIGEARLESHRQRQANQRDRVQAANDRHSAAADRSAAAADREQAEVDQQVEPQPNREA